MQIAQRIFDTAGVRVSRATIDQWRRDEGCGSNRKDVKPRKKYIPWVLHGPDRTDKIARLLRLLARHEDDHDLTPYEENMVNEFLEELHSTNRVLTYGVTGFRLIPRDPAIDAPDDIVRRP